MSANSSTNPSLILRLHSWSDVAAWDEFSGLYGPMVYRFGLRRGLQDADARELVQNVLMGVAKRIEHWTPDRERGTFRTWLYRIARNQWVSMVSRQRHDVAVGGSDIHEQLNNQPASSEFSTDQELEYREELFRVAAAQVRESCSEQTWQAFWRTAIDGEDSSDVAQNLGLSLGAVYIARSRVTSRLRTLIQSWESNDAAE
jgi:RNA polymerase sigma factor (sigma-70 family)